MNDILFYIFIILMSIYYYHLMNNSDIRDNYDLNRESYKLFFHYLLIHNIQNMNQNNNQNNN